MPDKNFFRRGFRLPRRLPWAGGPWFAVEIALSAAGLVAEPLHLGGDLLGGIAQVFGPDTVIGAGDYPIVVCYPERTGSAADWGMVRVYAPGRWLVWDRECEFVAVPGFVFGNTDPRFGVGLVCPVVTREARS